MVQDIQIASIRDGYYDRVLENNDFQLISGRDCLQQVCDLKLNTRWGEIQNPTYQEWGNHAWEAIKENNTEMARVMIEESFRQALEELDCVGTIDYLEVEIDPTPPGGVRVVYSVTGTDGTKINNVTGA
jgi:hypothetical protein